MSNRTLCRNGFEVSLNIQGNRTMLAVTHGADNTTRFWTNTSNLERALRGEPVEIAEHEGRFRVVVNGPETIVEFRDEQGLGETCTFQTREMLEALAEARERGPLLD